MRSVSMFTMFATLLSFGAIALGPGSASAAPCCSAPMCQNWPPNPHCIRCNEDCVEGEEEDLSREDPEFLDDAQAMCLAGPAPTPIPDDDSACGERADDHQ